MPNPPELETEHLILRPLLMEDAPDIQRLAGDFRISDTTANIPHPYENGMAEEFIRRNLARYQESSDLTLAMQEKSTGDLVGCVGIRCGGSDYKAEMGYWVGREHWNKGYCTEAARAMLKYAFYDRGLNRITAHHMARNPASGRVMEKIGMRKEGYLRQALKKWDKFEDVLLYAILKEDWERLGG